MSNFDPKDEHLFEQLKRFLMFLRFVSKEPLKYEEKELQELLSIDAEELSILKSIILDTKQFFKIIASSKSPSMDKIQSESSKHEIKEKSDAKEQLFKLLMEHTKSDTKQKVKK